jgi:rare lipoprotein A
MNGHVTSTNRTLRFSIVAGAVLTFALCLNGRSMGRAVAAPHAVSGKPAVRTLEARRHWFQFGSASWYGQDFQGQPTASGESYDMNSMTCAHRSLPLGSLIRVTNLRNHRSVFVRVNDRGPVPESRVLDLSYAAARTLGFSAKGLAKVRIDLISPRPTRALVAKLTYPELSSRD